MYQIIFSDIDGTLLNSTHQITKATKERIRSLSIPFVLVSARMPQGIYPLFKQLQLNTPMICYSGGLVLDQNHHIMYQRTFDLEQSNRIFNYIKTFFPTICVSAYSLNQWLVEDISNPWVQQEKEITNIDPNLMRHDHSIFKFLCMSDPHDIMKLEEILAEQFADIMIYRSKDTYLEIMPNGVSKSKAIQIVCKYYHTSVNEAIAFGDNYNDMEMLKTVKMGILMGNAPQALKKQIPYHTLSNNEDGIVKALNKLNLK